jgi:anti-sigma regulatory factor (Ser/Thr protein kinase)
MTHRTRTRHFRHDPREIGVARGWVREVLSAWGLSDQVAAMQLAVSELVTNAIMHGEGSVGVTLEDGPGQVRLVVSDEGHGRPIRRPSATLDEGVGGWGLGLVDSLADGWGTWRTAEGTAVWLVRRTGDNPLAGGTGHALSGA